MVVNTEGQAKEEKQKQKKSAAKEKNRRYVS